MKKFMSQIGLVVGFMGIVNIAAAQWSQNDDTGPYDYNNSDNWTGGIVSGTFTGTSAAGLMVTFGEDTTVGNIYITLSNTNILFLGEGGDRMLKLTGSINAAGINGARNYTFGSNADGQRLAIDLSGGDRTIATAQGRVITFLNEVTSSDGANGIIKTGAGALILSHTANTFGGNVTVSGGRVTFSSISNIGEVSALGQGSAIELAAGGNSASNTVKLQFGGDGLTVSADATSNRVITLTGGTTYFNIDNQSGHTLTLTANFINAATGTATKTLTISGNNGSVTEISGVIGNASAAGATAVTGGGQNNSGVSFVLRLSNTANTFSGAFSTGYDTVVEVTKLANRGAASSLGTGADNAVITIGGTGSDYGSTLRYIGGGDAETDRPIAFEFRRNSTNVIANNSVTNGNLSFTNSGDWSVAKSIATSATGNHTLSLQGTSTGTGSISGRIVDSIGSTTVSSTIVTESGTEVIQVPVEVRQKTSLTVNSAGVWRLTGENTYTGNTTVSAGTLLVDGALAGTGTVTVSAGAKLGGSGTINAASLLNVSGKLVPGGDNAVGTLTVGALTLLNGSSLMVDINSDTLTGDLLRATSAVNLGKGIASLSAGVDLGNSLLAENSVLTILQTDSVLSGTFTNSEIQIGRNLFEIHYLDHAIQLWAVPEPRVALLLILGGLFLALTVRTKKIIR